MADEKEEKPIDQMTFKEASVELEQVVRSLESGELELEESLRRYQRGVELLRSLRERLANAQQQVEVLTAETAETQAPDTTAAPATAFIDE